MVAEGESSALAGSINWAARSKRVVTLFSEVLHMHAFGLGIETET